MESLPKVTVQVPIYNEWYVAARAISAVCNLDYPRSLMQVQVLDDSTDDTSVICEEIVAHHRRSGVNVQYVHRAVREGFKAGALREGLKSAEGDYVAIFDCDFVPRSDFLLRTLPYFSSEKIALVQTRWTHLNEEYSILTRALGASLDYHFLIEQAGRDSSGLFLNFNGTAGIWRKEAIVESGGWRNALAEDFDLSVRAQLSGWRLRFVPSLECPAELPVQMPAAKRQQFRWAKGAAECTRRYLVPIAKHWSSPFVKLNTFVQLTRNVQYVLVLLQFLILPFLMQFKFDIAPVVSTLIQMSIGPPLHYVAVRKMYGKETANKIKNHLLLLFHSGVTFNNAKAFLEGVFGIKSDFLRTPKFGISGTGGEWRDKRYLVSGIGTAGAEIALAAYGIASMLIALFTRNFLLLPYIGTTTIGLLYVGALSLYHSLGVREVE
jgi:cellulose synthase/poly-beta-1,6-N-acetylglucosamine synthase-like glycosyltransferase